VLGWAVQLSSYSAAGVARAVLAIDRPDASILLLDCRASGLHDARLVAHLAPEEPPANAELLACMYVRDPSRGRPRRITREDLTPRSHPSSRPADGEPSEQGVLARNGHRFRLAAVCVPSGPVELRWTHTSAVRGEVPAQPVSLRTTLGALQSYEPARAMTAHVLQQACSGVSVLKLRGELQRLERSPIVLNRGLREAVARSVAAGLALSAIAMRCGRFKHDRRGQRSGETSWLARRIGQMPEGGQSRPTPWIHSDTLALIAREGLGLSPREVEL
jgi:hypothetical protein